MEREGLALWLEEVARQVREGEIPYEEGSIPVPEEAEAQLRSREKKGRRKVRLEFEWEEGKEKKGEKIPAPENEAQQKNDKDGSASVKDYERHVFVCCGGDCKKRGAGEVQKSLKGELKSRGMGREVRVDKVDCFGYCKHGPNVVIYPEGTWYLGLKGQDVPEVAEKHLELGEPVEHLAAVRRNGKKR